MIPNRLPGVRWEQCVTTARPTPTAADDDAALVLAAASGDRAAFGTIYDRYADRLHDFCVGMLRDRDAAAMAVRDRPQRGAGPNPAPPPRTTQ